MSSAQGFALERSIVYAITDFLESLYQLSGGLVYLKEILIRVIN